MEKLFVYVFLSISITLQVILISILNTRLKDIIKLLQISSKELNKEKQSLAENSRDDVKVDSEALVKKTLMMKKQSENMLPVKENEELLFFKKIKLGKAENLIEMDIRVDGESK